VGGLELTDGSRGCGWVGFECVLITPPSVDTRHRSRGAWEGAEARL